MKRNTIRTLVAAGLLGTLTSIAQTSARLLPFQARLTDVGGKPLADGVRAVQI